MKKSRFSEPQILRILKQADNGVQVARFAGNTG